MTWLKIESSVARNPKLLRAGPAASWLWVCGLAYCQESLTDGLIPCEAIEMLGVKHAARYAPQLVAAGLWEQDPKGWRVHDYLVYQRSAAEIAKLRQARRAGGGKGGRPKHTPENLPDAVKVLDAKPSDANTQNLPTQTEKTFPVSVSVSVSDSGAAADLVKGESEGEGPPLDLWLKDLQADYPQQRATWGYDTETAFVKEFLNDSRPAAEVWAEMQAHLEQQNRSYEWRVKRMIPHLDKWLKEGRWKQILDEDPPPSEQLAPKTSRTLAAMQAILNKP